MKNPLNIVSTKIVEGLENFFEWYAKKVSKHPFIVILACLLITGVSLIGLINYREENNAFKLWIPDNSDFVVNNEWLERNAPLDIRFNSLIVSSPGGNILTPETILHLSQIRNKVAKFKTTNGYDWGTQCYRRNTTSPPTVSLMSFGSSDQEIPYPELCSLLEQNTIEKCFEQNILEFWPQGFDFNTLSSISQIIEAINNASAVSSIFQTKIQIEDFVGGNVVKKDGKVVSAEATSMVWFGKVDLASLGPGDISSAGTGEAVDKKSLEWEAALNDVLEDDKVNLPTGVETLINVGSSYSDVAGETIVGDALFMPVGFMIVFVYVTIMLGKFSCTEQRGLLALGGLICIGLTLGFTYGFCSAVNLFYGPMHNIIPFLLLGIGIDDMFVIMQCYDNLGQQKTDNIIANVGLTMRHAGVAITVTSFTDFIVFALGATTVLPALRSFCLWCSVGIIMVYFFQATLFVAFLSLDCRRLAANRNGLCFCYVHKVKDEKKNIQQIDLSISQKCFKIFSKFLFSIPGIIVALALSAVLLSGGICGLTFLEQKFDPVWFLPPSSQIFKWFEANDKYFPSNGAEVTVYIVDIDWDQDLDKVGTLVKDLTEATDVVAKVNEWHSSLVTSNLTQPCINNNQNFSSLLTCFLFSTPKGFMSQGDFKLINGEQIVCGVPAPPILLGKFSFTHNKFSSRNAQIDALNKIKDIINDVKFSKGRAFPMSRDYSNWETDEVITFELFRNLGLAVACVFVTTLILLADFLGSVYVLLCVILTLVDLCGYMHFWGLTIDVVSSVNIIIAIGLCVDYSAHICHTFLTVGGTRLDRSTSTLVNIGPAVLNGGVSTFIAFILLANSDSHVFSSFFKIFFLVVVFGLFHGLVLLPVILRVAGPRSYSRTHSQPQVQEKINELDLVEKM